MKDLKVNTKRLKDNLYTLSEIGKNQQDGGIYRMAFSKYDLEARQWLKDKIISYGFEPKEDGAGNISCSYAGESEDFVLMGSHIDTVPCAGFLDGSLGVLVGLECLYRMKELKLKPKYTVKNISFTDEEGRFGGMFGSQAYCGMISPDTLFNSIDLENNKLFDVMEKLGYNPYKALEANADNKNLKYYLEVHIEQGPVLDKKKLDIGIVERITGLFRWTITINGESQHAGTTPMEYRRDAFLALADFAHEITRVINENGSKETKATIGKTTIIPGAANTVPSCVEFSLDVRDSSPEILQELKNSFLKVLSAITRNKKLTFSYNEVSYLEPTNCSKEVINLLENNAKQLKLKYLKMNSGAAHDAQNLAKITNTGMIFIPSKDGKSHSPAEWSDWADIFAGANLALNTLVNLAICK